MVGTRNLVVAPHPDDAELGCLTLLGPEDVVLVMSSTGERFAELLDSGRRFGFTVASSLDYPDGSMVCDRGMVSEIEHAVNMYQPKRVVTPPALDAHQDHRAVAAAALAAVRRSWVGLFEYESPSALPGWEPNTYAPTGRGNLLEAINRLREAYPSQQHNRYFDPSFLLGRASYRGLAVGAGYAVAFRNVRQTLVS